jgi:hypothetical protein
MPTYYKAFGSSVWIESLTSPTQLVKIGTPGTITGPNETRETSDVTNHDSPDETREFVATLINSGEVGFPVKLSPGTAGFDLLRDHLKKTDPNGKGFRIYFPLTTGDYVEGSMHVTAVSPTYPIDDVIGCDVTFQLTGPVSYYDQANPSSSDLYT